MERVDLVCTTTSEGLGVETRDGEASVSQHFGAPLFQRGEYARHELAQILVVNWH